MRSSDYVTWRGGVLRMNREAGFRSESKKSTRPFVHKRDFIQKYFPKGLYKRDLELAFSEDWHFSDRGGKMRERERYREIVYTRLVFWKGFELISSAS